MSYIVIGAVLGPVQTNCYGLINENSGEALIVDASGNINKLLDEIEKHSAHPVAVLLTHGHFDHIDAVDKVRKAYPDIKVYIGKNEVQIARDPMYNLSFSFIGDGVSVEPDVTVSDGETISLIGLDIKCIEVPGHTIGGMCYYIENVERGDVQDSDKTDSAKTNPGKPAGVLFDGDTLFRGSIGRSDFPTGDGEALVENIRTKLLTLPEDTMVYPGHDSRTTIGWEKDHNLYF